MNAPGFEILTSSEQRLLAVLPATGTITVEAAAGVLKKRFRRKYLSELLSRLARKGKLARLKNGAYGMVGMPSLKGVLQSEQGLYPGAYAAFSTALYLHGLLDQRPSTLFLATEKTYGSRSMQGFEVRLVGLGKDFWGTQELEGIRVSTKAKTYYDCLARPKWVGGFKKALEALQEASLSRQEWMELAEYVKEGKKKRLADRIAREGKRMEREGRKGFPAFFRIELEALAKGKT